MVRKYLTLVEHMSQIHKILDDLVRELIRGRRHDLYAEPFPYRRMSTQGEYDSAQQGTGRLISRYKKHLESGIEDQQGRRSFRPSHGEVRSELRA